METIVVKSKIKDVAKGCNVSGDFADALNKAAVDAVKEAAKRAEANGRKTVQAKDVYVGKTSASTMLVVKSKVKDVVSDVNIAGDFADALNEILIWHVHQACGRAEENSRKTVAARDL